MGIYGSGGEIRRGFDESVWVQHLQWWMVQFSLFTFGTDVHVLDFGNGRRDVGRLLL